MNEILEALVKYAAILAFMLGVVAPVMVWVERRGMALIQDRRGPNRVGPFGLLQPLADAFKFIFKEEIIPAQADKVLYLAAPALALVPALTTFTVVPFGPTFNYAGKEIKLVVIDSDIGALMFLALAGLGVYSLICAGYGSYNKYSLLGSLRASAQLISYELSMGFAILAILVSTASFNLLDVIDYQNSMWNIVYQPLGFLVFLVTAFAETNRVPFDLPESESELVAGFNTEYGAMKFALFFMGEYVNMTTLSLLLAVLYLGGWQLYPGWTPPEGIVGAIIGVLITLAKVIFMMWLFVWVRFTLPRFRYDQLMKLGWKVLLPLSITNLVIVTILVNKGIL